MGQLEVGGNGAKGANGGGVEATRPGVIQSFEPATGALIGEVPILSAAEVRAVVARARRAQQSWALVPVAERGARLLRYRAAVVAHADEIVELLARETGKPRQEALLHEVLVVADFITYFVKAAPKMLAPRERSLHLLKYRRAIVEYVPRGVVGVIAPWNFPFQLPLRDVICAVLAGNAVVVKPSEVTPLILLKAKELWDGCGLPPDLFGVVTGVGPTGAALIDSGVDFIAFTGSVKTGKRVAAACGERLIPCVMELGGKAPLIACADADIERTARAVVGGGFANSGQVCVSVERVYAHDAIHDRLVDRVVELTRALRVGDPARESCDLGAITFPAQIDVAEQHVADAVKKGAVVRCGGKRMAPPGQRFEPTILTGCSHEQTVMTEEIFGPIVPIMRVASDDEAVALANDSHLGLNAYVYSEDAAHGRRIAERIDAGSVLVNDVLVNGGLPEAPFGGIKQSGFGRVLGEEGLRDMCQLRHINVERVRMAKKNPLGFPYTDKGYAWFMRTLRVLYAEGSVLGRIAKLF